MYRARVEAVSGLKVLAGGKWLNIIGNKNVRAGDLIWTDGRCVYGNEQTPQQSHVITPPKKDFGIPLYLRYADSECFVAATFTKDLEIEPAPLDSKIMIISNNKNSVVSHEYRGGFIGFKDTLAINIDANGNIYELKINGAGYSIVKNSIEIEKFSVAGKAPPYKFPHFPVETSRGLTIWGGSTSALIEIASFIADENNWWLIFFHSDIFLWANGISHWRMQFFLKDKQGLHRLWDTNGIDSETDTTLKIPLHDDFYFKFNGANPELEVGVDPNTGKTEINFSLKIKVTVYSPQDQKLIDFETSCVSMPYYLSLDFTQACFSACKLAANKFLVSLRNTGIYLGENGKSEKIFEGKVYNQCLRPMKHYKYWWEDIQSLD